MHTFQATQGGAFVVGTTAFFAGTLLAHAEDFSFMYASFAAIAVVALISAVPVTKTMAIVLQRSWVWFLFPVSELSVGIFLFSLWTILVALIGNNARTEVGRHSLLSGAAALVLTA